jgi:hypothetical protein
MYKRVALTWCVQGKRLGKNIREDTIAFVWKHDNKASNRDAGALRRLAWHWRASTVQQQPSIGSWDGFFVNRPGVGVAACA